MMFKTQQSRIVISIIGGILIMHLFFMVLFQDIVATTKCLGVTFFLIAISGIIVAAIKAVANWIADGE